MVIVGRSLIVSKPLASLLMAPGPNATVTLTHKHTTDLASHTRMADILVVAVGKPGLITADMVKPGAMVIDVGVNRVPDEDAAAGTGSSATWTSKRWREVARAITPVPGGVGPMTITMLLANTLEAAAESPRGPARGQRAPVSWDLFSSADAARREAASEVDNEALARAVAADRADRGFPAEAAPGEEWTVSRVNAAARELVEGVFPPLLGGRARSRNFTRARSGHCYFSLRDAGRPDPLRHVARRGAAAPHHPRGGDEGAARWVASPSTSRAASSSWSSPTWRGAAKGSGGSRWSACGCGWRRRGSRPPRGSVRSPAVRPRWGW